MTTRMERLRSAVAVLRGEGCQVHEQWAVRLARVDGSGHEDLSWGTYEQAVSLAGRQWAEIAKRGPEGIQVRPCLIQRLVILTPAVEVTWASGGWSS